MGGTAPYDVVLIGRKRTSFARANLAFLLDEIAPEIVRRGLADRFRFALLGPQTPAEDQAARLAAYPFIVDEGYVANMAERVNRADAMLHAVKYRPSAGSRFGMLCSVFPCLVAHDAIHDTVPELVDGGACLTAADGAGFVDALLRACEDRALNRRLRQNARDVFDRHLSYADFAAFFNEAVLAAAGRAYDASKIAAHVYDLEAPAQGSR